MTTPLAARLAPLCFLLLLCLLLLTVPGVRARADEFIGPLAGWADVKQAPYRAAGDGVADDTDALQAALNDLGTPGHAHVLYLPAGTYLISRSLTLSARAAVSLLGEDPATTTIKWAGASAPQAFGAMIAVNGCWFSRYGRLTWDGGGIAVTGWHDYWDGNPGHAGTFFPTGNEHADEVFQNLAYGIRVGQRPQIPGAGGNTGDAETPLLRCKFLHCSVAGVSIQDPNALDWFLWDCTFDHCGRGVTNNPPTEGAGNFHVYDSVFRHSSVADVTISNTGYFSLRGNYSLGSHQFLVAAWQGANPAQITLQKNVVLDTEATPVDVSNAGPLMLIDNVFRSAPGQAGPAVRVGVGANQEDTLSVGNVYTVPDPIRAGGRLRTLDDAVVARSVLHSREPNLPGALPNLHRPIHEVSPGGGGAEIQRALQSAALERGRRPVVHVPAGIHLIPNTLTFPAGADVQLVGDGFGISSGTTLKWAGAAGGTVVRLESPSRATLRDLEVISTGAATGIQVFVGDRPGDRVFMEQGDVWSNRKAGLLYNGLTNTVVELHDFYHSDSRGAGVSVLGGGRPGPGRVSLFGGDGSNDFGLSYDVRGGGRLLVEDVWYEAHPDPKDGRAPRFIRLAGAGTFTLQGGHVSAQTDSVTPVIAVDGFAGRASFLGLTLAANYGSLGPSRMTLQNEAGPQASILALGMIGDTEVWFVDHSSGAQFAFLNNKAPDPAGSKQVPDRGRRDDAFLRQMLAQTRTTYPTPGTMQATPPGATDVRFYRVLSDSGDHAAAISDYNVRIDRAAGRPGRP